MTERINDNELLTELDVIEGALEYVQKINKILPVRCYLTIRPESVLRGTKSWLDAQGFPDAPIVARPVSVPKIDGNKWKTEILNYLYPWVAGIVDDNAGLVSYLPDEYQGSVYLFDNKESCETKLKVFACPTWEDVYNRIKG